MKPTTRVNGFVAPGFEEVRARGEPAGTRDRRRITFAEAEAVGAILMLDWDRVDLGQFRRGLEVELEHGTRDRETNVTNDDLVLTGKIALAHLNEFPDYYTRLDELEADATRDETPLNGGGSILPT